MPRRIHELSGRVSGVLCLLCLERFLGRLGLVRGCCLAVESDILAVVGIGRGKQVPVGRIGAIAAAVAVIGVLAVAGSTFLAGDPGGGSIQWGYLSGRGVDH